MVGVSSAARHMRRRRRPPFCHAAAGTAATLAVATSVAAMSGAFMFQDAGFSTAGRWAATSGVDALPDGRRIGSSAERHRPASAPAAGPTAMAAAQAAAPNQGEEAYEVVVAGGGLAGLNAALRLGQLPWTKPTRVVIVDPKDRFVFLPLLVDYAISDVVGLEDLAPPYETLLKAAARERPPAPPFVHHADVEFLQGEVVGIDQPGAKVEVVDQAGHRRTLRYEAMLLSPGLARQGTQGRSRRLPGEAQSPIAQRFATLQDAEELRARLKMMGSQGRIAIVGGGYVGVELAASLAETGRDVMLFYGSALLKDSRPENVKRATERLGGLGVELRRARVTAVGADHVAWRAVGGVSDASDMAPTLAEAQAEEGRSPCNVVIVTGAGEVPPFGASLGATGQAVCRIGVDKQLRAAAGIFCLGDAALPEELPEDTGAANGVINGVNAPLNGQTAMAQAEVAAWNAFAQVSGLPPSLWREFNGKNMGEFLTLGKADAAGAIDASKLPAILPSALPALAAQLAAPIANAAAEVAPPTEINVDGLPAAAIRRLAYLYRLPTIEHRLKVAARWAQQVASPLTSSLQQQPASEQPTA